MVEGDNDIRFHRDFRFDRTFYETVCQLNVLNGQRGRGFRLLIFIV